MLLLLCGAGWFFWNFRTEFEPHWDFLEAYRRGWFPRNVSDYEALQKLGVCDKDPPTLSPTTVHKITHGGIYGGVIEQHWLVRNWLPLTVGAVGGAAVAVIISCYVARGTRSTNPLTQPLMS